MVTQQSRAATDGDRHGDDRPHLVSFGALLAAVVGVLLLGAVLRTEAPESRAEDSTMNPRILVAGPREPAQHRPLVAGASGDRLAERMRDDVGRLGHASDEWTAQLGLFCDALRARQLLDQFGDLAAFHVLPSLHRDQPCYRICWGQYGTAGEAKAARDLPPSLRKIMPSPFPKPVDEILE